MSEKRRSSSYNLEEQMELRKGPWTLEEDSLLIHYIACHGEGRWNLLARASGLKRTGKSCRLRWMNYLKPGVKKGNLTPEEQLLILELHSKLGNRGGLYLKPLISSPLGIHSPRDYIQLLHVAALHSPQQDNEIKNYWRTRVQRQARQLRVDANSNLFRDAVRCYWNPRLRLEKTNFPRNSEHANTNGTTVTAAAAAAAAATTTQITQDQQQLYHLPNRQDHHQMISNTTTPSNIQHLDFESSSTSSCSALLPHLLLPSRSSSDELSNVVTFSPFSGGYTSWDDQAPVSASALSAAADSNFGIDIDGLWCMDELHDMFKSYTSSGAQPEVLSGL